jgi:hypothetical protein
MPFLDGPDPLLRIQPEVAVGDHPGRLLQRRLSLLDHVRDLAGGWADLRPARIQGHRLGGTDVGEALATTDSHQAVAGLTGASVRGVLEH